MSRCRRRGEQVRGKSSSDGEGKGSSSGESQGQDRGEGSASGENQGGDRNAKGSGSSDDEDECKRERQRRVRGDIEHGRQESNQEEIDFSSIPETFMAITGAVTIAVVDFHNSGAISSTILSLVIAINVFGFLCCMTSMLHRHRNPRVARIFETIGVAVANLGLLLLVSVFFSSYYGWIILGLGKYTNTNSNNRKPAAATPMVPKMHATLGFLCLCNIEVMQQRKPNTFIAITRLRIMEEIAPLL